MTTITPKEAELIRKLLAMYHEADFCRGCDWMADSVRCTESTIFRSLEFKVGYPEPVQTAEEKAMERADYLNDCARDAKLEAKLSPN